MNKGFLTTETNIQLKIYISWFNTTSSVEQLIVYDKTLFTRFLICSF